MTFCPISVTSTGWVSRLKIDTSNSSSNFLIIKLMVDWVTLQASAAFTK